MTTFCEKCARRDLVSYQKEPQEVWRLFVQKRWRHICPNCFNGEAERVGIRFQFSGMRASVVERHARADQASG